MGDMGSQNMMSYTSYDGFLTGLLSLLIKALFIILIISIIIGVTLWIKNNYFKNVNFTQYVNQNPITKSAVGIIAAIFILFLLLYFFNYLTGSNYGMGGYGITFNFAGIIMFLFKALTFIFVITLIVSLVAYMIKQLGITDLHLFQFTSKATQDNTTTNTNNTNNSYINVPTPAEEQDNDTI